MVIQVTSEAVGIYSPAQQMAMVRAVEPEAVSLAIRELVPDGEEAAARDFLAWLVGPGIPPQYIHFAPDAVERFGRMPAAGRPGGRRVGKKCVSTCRSRWWPYH